MGGRTLAALDGPRLMRLQRLDLLRYGKFTDLSLDFGTAAEGAADLHIVYGPNETGKSTALSAYLDLLFGIGVKSPYNFLHPYTAMRIGGVFEIAGKTQAFIRIKRPQNSLLDAGGKPITDAALQAALGGVDRDSYRTMFSLDDETIEAGGESILASKGDLGELLFSASAGVADISRKLGELRNEADAFYKYRAHSGELAKLKAQLMELKAEREGIDTQAPQYALRIEARDLAAAGYESAIDERSKIQARLAEIQRRLTALPRLAALRVLRETIAPLADLPDAPAGWAQALPALQTAEIELAVNATRTAEEIRQMSTQLETLVVDEAALGLEHKSEKLAELRARHLTADKDIPERLLQSQEAAHTIAGILGKIERAGEIAPESLILAASTVGRLRELIEMRSGLDAAIRSAQSELAEARSRRQDAIARLQGTAGAAQDNHAEDSHAENGQALETQMAALAATVAAWRMDDHAARRRLAERANERARAALADRMRALAPWQGDADTLAAMVLPETVVVQAWKAAIGDLQNRINRHADEAERLASETLRLGAERDAIGAVTGLVTDQQAADIRASREQAWAEHRRRLDGTSADSFEAALRQDDIVMAGRISHLAERAKLHQTSQALAIATAAGERASALRAAAAGELRTIFAEIAGALGALALPPKSAVELQQLESWLERRQKALDERSRVVASGRELHEAQADGLAARTQVSNALNNVGVAADSGASFEALLGVAQSALNRAAERHALRSAADMAQRDVAARERTAKLATDAGRDWDAAWTAACASCWFGEKPTIPTLAHVREILGALAELSPILQHKASLADRISKMEIDQAAFQEEATAQAAALQMGPAGDDVLALAQAVNDRVRKAASARVERMNCAETLRTASERQRALATEIALHDERKAQMTRFFSVSALADVAGRLADIGKRATLRAQASEAERDILGVLGVASLSEAERALDAADRGALEAEEATLKARLDDSDLRCRELFATHSKAADQVEAIGSDSRVVEIEMRRRTTLLEIEEAALRYLRLRTGTAATEHALRAYRDRHRSSMITRASEAFRAITRSEYSGLATQPEKEGETLIALPAGGGSKLAGELSKGTRFQLYLALRIAGYHEFARARAPVPFIADDIMETFDEFRSHEAFRLFGEMARVGQVIYLTHHEHLCKIALEACPAAKIHRLAPNAPARI